MTREEELDERVERLASRFERISESQAKYEILEALKQVEREVLGNVIACTQRYQQFAFEQRQSREFEAGFRAAARVMEDWVAAQAEDIMTCVDDKHELSKQIEQQAKELGKLKSEIYLILDGYYQLEQENKTLREALQLLYDCQNGCPLPKYEADWTRAMELAARALKVS